MIRKQLRPAILLTVVFIVVTGFVYPGIVTALAIRSPSGSVRMEAQFHARSTRSSSEFRERAGRL